jgi:RNA polymerase sigma factor (sigma-70 family)
VQTRVEEAFVRYGPMVLRRCRRLLRDESEAVDAMQDVFVNLLRFQEQLHDAALSSLLFRMATNVCLNRLRTHKRRPQVDSDAVVDLIAHAPDQETGAARRGLLGRVFGRTPESTKTIAVLHFVDGMTLAEVAREVGLSVSGVRKRLAALSAQVAELQGAQP